MFTKWSARLILAASLVCSGAQLAGAAGYYRSAPPPEDNFDVPFDLNAGPEDMRGMFDNRDDPYAPYGGNAAVLAPPGTDGYFEENNNRRYFCRKQPARC